MFNIVAISITEMQGGTNCLRYITHYYPKHSLRQPFMGLISNIALRGHYW